MKENIIFNSTFTNDKTIYYPSNWQSGKTAIQLYEEFKNTTTFFLLKNVSQSAIAAMWIFIIYVVINSLRQIWRLNKLDNQNIQKKYHSNFLRKKFLVNVGIVTVIITLITLGLIIISQWTRMALQKGLMAWIIFLIMQFLYKKISNRRVMKNNNYSLMSKREQ